MSVALRGTGIQTVAIEIVSEIGSIDVLTSSDIMGTAGDVHDLAAGTGTTEDVHDLAAGTPDSSTTTATGAPVREATTKIGMVTGTQARGTIRGTSTIATSPTRTEIARGTTMTGAVRGDSKNLRACASIGHPQHAKAAYCR